MTIRAKLAAAIVMTVLGPIATTAVALHGMGQMSDRFDEVQVRSQHEAIARELKFGVTDLNGWQTAYGYDHGRSRPVFERSVAQFRRELRIARATLTDPRERQLLSQLRRDFAAFMAIDAVAYRALQAGDEQRVRDLFLGPEIAHFSSMAQTADQLADYQRRRAVAAERAFDEARDDARKRLITVALGAGVVIVLLLVTARDLVRRD
jgi:hypothetical protein